MLLRAHFHRAAAAETETSDMGGRVEEKVEAGEKRKREEATEAEDRGDLVKSGKTAADDFGVRLDSEIEVLWDVSPSSSTPAELDRVWWPGTVKERLSPAEGDSSPRWRLKYKPYAGFEEEERVVTFLEDHLLVDLAEKQELEWRKVGDAYEPAEEEETGDQIVTIDDIRNEVAEEGEEQQGLAELTKMPFDKQQVFASKYRLMADSFKEKLREIVSQKGEGCVVNAEDIHRVVENMKASVPS